MTTTKKRLLTGDRPTGKLHLGHYVGSIENRVKLQEEYDCYFIIADLHMLTTRCDKASISEVHTNIRDMVLDYLACGIDPQKSTIFVQSQVPATYELNLYFEMLVTLPRLTRLPTIKDMARAASLDDESVPFGLVGYPVLQAADILLPRASLVPVGRDNESHVEIAREIARRFNRTYEVEVFPEPDALVPSEKLLPGTDGNPKMGKSLNNSILLSDDAKTVEQKVRGMYTDPARIRADIPGTVEGNPVFTYHDYFNDNVDEVNDLKERYRAGKVGDVEVKRKLSAALNRFLTPIRERRAQYEGKSDLLNEVIADGTARMNGVANETMRLVHDAMGLFPRK
jgi:tryptophanyl-tRNA synthetase